MTHITDVLSAEFHVGTGAPTVKEGQSGLSESVQSVFGAPSFCFRRCRWVETLRIHVLSTPICRFPSVFARSTSATDSLSPLPLLAFFTTLSSLPARKDFVRGDYCLSESECLPNGWAEIVGTVDEQVASWAEERMHGSEVRYKVKFEPPLLPA